MQFLTMSDSLSQANTDCLIIQVNSNRKLNPIASEIDQATGGLIKSTLKLGDFSGQLGESQLLTNHDGIKAKRLLLVGCGDKEALSVNEFRRLIKTALTSLTKTKAKTALSSLHQIAINNQSIEWAITESVLLCAEHLYSFTALRSTKTDKPSLTKLSLYAASKSELSKTKKLTRQAGLIAEGIALTKNLANTPANICNPTYLAKQAKTLAKEFDRISVEVIDEEQAKKLGMGSFYSVAQGSDTPGKIIIMQYKGAKKASERPITFVGKGITFDTGGNCIKQAIPMYGMKYDMCGAATLFGVIKACALLELPINLVCAVASAENMVSGRATRPSDVVTSLSGQTIEITNTDAEGRLVLCDTLTYIDKYKPSKVISVATLTGAAIVSLGYETSALMANDQNLANELLEAGLRSEDRAWQLPLHEDYHHYLQSKCADMLNGALSRTAGTVISGCFLSNFTQDYHWAHLDIAGSSIIQGSQPVASGRPIPLLMNYLLNQTKS